MKTKEIRESFTSYFEKLGHTPVASSLLVPDNDPTLLFINAGMNQFKNVFTGLEQLSYSRAVSTQKCVRAGGKHNDLDNVGHTARHHTFFEMLGNFSFGDYFKKEAIHYAWDFLTNELKIPKDRLYVTCFETDDEAAEIWQKQEGVPSDRIFRFGEKDNFWRMGKSGPCGPCSEIFFDLGPDVGGDPAQNVMGGEGDRYMEIWNLVFMQFFEDDNGKQTALPNPSIDTGAGIERLAAVLQNENSNYHTDIFQSLIQRATSKSGIEYMKDISQLGKKDLIRQNERNIALRVIADHARTSAFLISDGVLPSNEGRGYVLRRIMRRAIRYGRTISNKGLLPDVAEEVILQMGQAYPEILQKRNLVASTLADEEKRFLTTLDQGTGLLKQELDRLSTKGLKTVDGSTVFKLYDTYGFPEDLTEIMAAENGFKIDDDGFKNQMNAAKERAKASWKAKVISGDEAHLIKFANDAMQANGVTKFLGYEGTLSADGKIIALSSGQETVNQLSAGTTGVLIFDQTPFYAESGGQVGDTGKVFIPGGEAEVLDCTKQSELHLLHIKVLEGTLKLGEICRQEVEESVHRNTICNHSATHLLHSALKLVLGNDVNQAGSLVESHRLRFDFTYNKPISIEEVELVEKMVNSEISKSHNVNTKVMTPEEAKKSGAMALFGEKYGDKVRVVKMGETSMELCGGTHVTNTSVIRIFKIVSEAGVSSGIRRIEAITGDHALRFLLRHTKENSQALVETGLQANWQQFLEGASRPVTDWIAQSRTETKRLEKEIQTLKGKQINISDLANDAIHFTSEGMEARLILADLPIDDRKLLSEITDQLKNRIQTGLVIVIGKGEESHPIIVSLSKNLIGPLNAGKILNTVANEMGGKGGGRPDFAQGAGKDRSKIKLAFAKATDLVRPNG